MAIERQVGRSIDHYSHMQYNDDSCVCLKDKPQRTRSRLCRFRSLFDDEEEDERDEDDDDDEPLLLLPPLASLSLPLRYANGKGGCGRAGSRVSGASL